MASPRIAIIGAGIGGLAAAIALRQRGIEAQVFEQAPKFLRIGAAIAMTPNAVKALAGLGLRDAVAARAHRPKFRVSRVWNTGQETSRLELGRTAEERYGAPQLTAHRADLLSALETALPAGVVHLSKRVSAIRQARDTVEITFSDGTAHTADAVIGADGIHSTVRSALFGREAPRFTGMVAFRSIVSATQLAKYDLTSFTKWWGPTPQSQIVDFLIDGGRELFIFATIAEREWAHESWSTPGTAEELRAGFIGYHREAQDLIHACEKILKTALYERDPLPQWTEGRVTLLGDACHPMMPFMAQGAAMGLEDAVALARCLDGVTAEATPAALLRYEASRLDRASRIQRGSRANDWLRSGVDADWVYGYDAWTADLPSTP